MTRRPEWASFFSPSAYRYFIQCVHAELDKRGLAYEPCDGGVILRERNITVGLVNLAQQCRCTVPPKWPELVAYLVDQLLAVADEQGVIEELVRDVPLARASLRVRLHADEYLRSSHRDDFVTVRVTSSVSLCIAWDLPTSVRLLTREDIRAWDLPDAKLVELGLENVRANEPVERSVLENDAGILAYELSGASHFAASHALLLDAYLDGRPTAIVWTPNRHTVFFAPTSRGESALRAAHAITPLAVRAFERGPGSLSMEPLWWDAGRLGDLPFSR